MIGRSGLLGWTLAALLMLSGCGLSASPAEEPASSLPSFMRYEGEMAPAIDSVYTTRKEIALTFNGLGDAETMRRLLNKLDEHGMKATFFLPGMRVAEEPEIPEEILRRGHEVGNNTLNRLDMSSLDYESVYEEIRLTNEIIEEKLGVVPKFVRTKTGDYTDEVRLATAQLGMRGVASYSINPRDWDGKSAEAIGSYFWEHMRRGGILSLNTDMNPDVVPALDRIAEAVDDVGYKLVPLSELVDRGGVRKPLEEIPGYDAASLNSDYRGANYDLVYSVDTDRKQVALTFDDWGSERTLSKLLDILHAYDVKATFFLRANGTEHTPNMARAMVEEGHEVANHTYSHPVLPKLTAERIQEEVVRAHRVITEAIQQQPSMLLRPPTGAIDSESAQAVAATGYTMIAQYDVTTFDWDPNVTAETIFNEVMTQTGPGSVILLHMLDDIHTLEALPAILEGLREKGYTIGTFSELLQLQKS
ncbi:polysaccharide deacetylase family protein [Paenibacillus sp. TRM 82003]|nr:polysaccharide deacetylase family protein [Paenibacillus sp. TRM 82003]